MSVVKLKKPPIMEMWVEFKFSTPSENWVQPTLAFLKEYEEEYPEVEITGEDKLEFRHVSPTKLPEIVSKKSLIKHLRANDGKGAKWLQLTPNQLVCSFLRLGEDYTGFSALSENAIDKLRDYVRICSPANVEYAAIHYVDIVEIPVPEMGEIELSDYFKLGLDLPRDVFGHQLSYLVRTMLRPPDGTGPLDIQLQLDGIDNEFKVFRFRLDWHKICPYDGITDFTKLSALLKEAHQSVMKCFRASFSDLTWQLFEPINTTAELSC